jgi:hypothetical protein
MSNARRKRFHVILDAENFEILRRAALHRSITRDDRSVSMARVLNDLISSSHLREEAAALQGVAAGLTDG